MFNLLALPEKSKTIGIGKAETGQWRRVQQSPFWEPSMEQNVRFLHLLLCPALQRLASAHREWRKTRRLWEGRRGRCWQWLISCRYSKGGSKWEPSEGQAPARRRRKGKWARRSRLGVWSAFCMRLIEAQCKRERSTQVRGYELHIKIKEITWLQEEERLASYEPLTKMTCKLSSLRSPEGSLGKASFCLCNFAQNITCHSFSGQPLPWCSLKRHGPHDKTSGPLLTDPGPECNHMLRQVINTGRILSAPIRCQTSIPCEVGTLNPISQMKTLSLRDNKPVALGTCLAVCAPNAGGPGLILDREPDPTCRKWKSSCHH